MHYGMHRLSVSVMTVTSDAPGREIMPIARPAAPKATGTPPTEKPKRRRGGLLGVWDSSIGKKYVMSVTGLLMLAFLLLHMLGNLKIFYGRVDFNSYSGYLRTLFTPILHDVWYLWIQRFVLTAALLLHITAALQLSRRDQKSRPTKYQHAQPVEGRFTTHSMRWGGLALLLFIIWHVLDMSAGVVAHHYVEHDVYDNTIQDFKVWYENVIYIVAMLALALHINHGFWSASITLGYNRPKRNAAIKGLGTTLAVAIAGGFIVIPVAVMTGAVS